MSELQKNLLTSLQTEIRRYANKINAIYRAGSIHILTHFIFFALLEIGKFVLLSYRAGGNVSKF